jgi:hypothetical protein
MTTYQKMGEWLVSAGLLNPAQLKEALKAQRAARGRLGEVLTAMGLVTEDQVLMCLSAQYDLPLADLDRMVPDQAALRLVSHAFAQANLFLPVEIRGSEIHVVCSDPIDIRPSDELTRITGKRCRLQLASPTSLYRSINRWFLDLRPFVAPGAESGPELEVVQGLAPSPGELPEVKAPARKVKIHSQEDRTRLLLLLNETSTEPGLWDKLTGS